MKKRPLPLILLILPAFTALLLSGCGVHGVHMQQSPLLKYFALRSGLIAYLGADGNIQIANQNGHVIEVTKNGQTGSSATITYGAPAWSFDGKQIVFCQFKNDAKTKTQTATVYTANASGKDLRKIYSTTKLAPFYFYWSPNDRKIGILSQVLASQGSVEMGVIRVTARKPQTTYRVLNSPAPFYWAWSPNGKSLVAHTQSSGAPNAPDFVRIYRANGQGDHYRQLKAYLGAFDTPAIADGGKDIVIPIGSADASDLYERNLATGKQRMLAKTLGNVSYSLSPNGKWLAYIDQTNAKNTSAGVLHVVNMKNPKDSFAVKERPVFSFYWSPNSREIAYIVPLQSKPSINSVFARSNNLPYAQLQVADVAKRDSWSVAQFPATRAFLDGLPFNDQYQRSKTIWSPNSKYLVFSALTAKKKPGIFVVQANGDLTPDRIAKGDLPSWSWR